jgi:hypothetical protein
VINKGEIMDQLIVAGFCFVFGVAASGGLLGGHDAAPRRWLAGLLLAALGLVMLRVLGA